MVRTARVQLQSRAIGEHIYHPAGAHAQLRNAIMRAKTSEDFYDRVAWLYGGPGLRAPGRQGFEPGWSRVGRGVLHRYSLRPAAEIHPGTRQEVTE